MRPPLRLLLFAAFVAVAVLAAPASAAPPGTRGVVVQRDARAGVIVVATKSGALQRVKLAKPSRLALGTRVSVRGTAVSVVGHTRQAKLRGVVVHRGKHAFSLAGNGSVLAIASASPPASGQQITTTVQVSSGSLSDDDGEFEVEDDQAPSAKLRGTVISQSATTLVLAVTGFPAGLAIALGTTPVPALAVGTTVEARVALGPDPSNPAGILLTLVSLRVDDGSHGDHGEHGDSRVEAEGQVTAITEAGAAGGAAGSITIDDEHGSVTFVIPAGFGPTGVAVGDKVEAKGTAGATSADPPTLVRLETSGGDDESQGDDSGDGGSQDKSGNND
jgi:hypothetical protein